MISDNDLGLNLYIMLTVYYIIIILDNKVLKKTN